MQRDVKIGVAIGVLLLALIVVFWWVRQAGEPSPTPSRFGEPASLGDEDVVVPPAGGSDVAVRWDDPAQAVSGQGDTVVAPPVGVPGPATPEPAPMGNPPPAPVVRKHVVQKGDVLIRLAKKYYNDGSKWQVIYEANRDKIRNPNALPLGAELTIPDLAASPVSTDVNPPVEIARQGVRKYTVKKGDTFWKFAKQFYGSESKWRRIFNANSQRVGTDPAKLKVGVVLVIPADNE